MPRILIGALILFAVAYRAAAAPPRDEVHFNYRPLAVGDQARETTRFLVDLKTVLAQDGQVINVADQKVERKEDAVVVRLAPAPGQTAKARVTYEVSQQTSQAKTGGGVDEIKRPVAGKTYIAARQGEQLVITDEQGNTPAEDELAIVARTMDGLGRPNPLGTFLNGKSLAVGQKIRLPAEYSSTLLAGWDQSLAKLPLDLMLMGIERVDGQMCALLHTPPSAQSGGQRPPVEGKFLIELDTCRVAVIELRGPIVAADRRGPPGEEFDVRRKGKLNVAVHVEHQRRR